MTEVMETIRNGRACGTVLIIVDYNMKFESLRVREACADYWAKHGMSCHGIVPFFKGNYGKRTYNDGMRSNGDAELSTLIVDHILKNYNT